MKKIAAWAFGIAIAVFVIVWGVIGVKIFTNDYDITAWAYIALACWVVIFAYALFRFFSNKCPHCGRLRRTYGKFCPHCGKEI